MKVAILGASDKHDRYSYKAMKMLLEHHHEVFLVHPKLTEIEGHAVHPHINELEEQCHTLTVYVNPKISDSIGDEIIAGGFKRVVFNPGSENTSLETKLIAAGVEVRNECTLVMLSIGNF